MRQFTKKQTLARSDFGNSWPKGDGLLRSARQSKAAIHLNGKLYLPLDRIRGGTSVWAKAV